MDTKVKYKSQYEWNKRNVKKVKEIHKLYREKHKIEIRKAVRQWALKNKDRVRENYKRWRKANLEKVRENNRRWFHKKMLNDLDFADRWYKRILNIVDKNGKKIYVLNPKLRFQVLERDKFTCQYCGRKAPEVELEVDHVIRRRENGKDEKNNLITACTGCNRGRG